MFVDRTVPTARQTRYVSDDAPLIEAARLLGLSDTDLVVVCDPQGRLRGVITKTDVVAR